MPYVVTGNCLKCRFTECVTVCPVECFHFDDQMTYIDPETCIDCGGCVAACPVQAIYEAATLPEDLHDWIGINATKAAELPVLSKRLEPLPEAETRKRELGF